MVGLLIIIPFFKFFYFFLLSYLSRTTIIKQYDSVRWRKPNCVFNDINYFSSEKYRTNLKVHRHITSYNLTIGIHFNPLVRQVSRSLHRGSIPLFRSQLTSSVWRRVDTVQEIFDPWIRLTQQVNLKKQAVGIGYRLHFVTSATKIADHFFMFSLPISLQE